jgi:hypothetical protein
MGWESYVHRREDTAGCQFDIDHKTLSGQQKWENSSVNILLSSLMWKTLRLLCRPALQQGWLGLNFRDGTGHIGN